MAGRRIVYIIALLGCVVFYWAYREWLSFLLMMAVVFLPWLSLLLSLPAMLMCRVSVNCPSRLTAGDTATVSCSCSSGMPLFAVKGSLEIQNSLTGQCWRQKSGNKLPTEHCGRLTVRPLRVWVYDYLGLVRLPLGKRETMSVTVYPVEQPVDRLPDTTRKLATALRPKPGGGFSEHHELRLYRPGDSLRQVHWKLSAKTGKLIFREAMEPLQGSVVVSVVLDGSPEELDFKLGRLCGISRRLCEKNIAHEIRCFTGSGLKSFPVEEEQQLQQAMEAVLGCHPAAGNVAPDFGSALWHCHIGGDDRG